ncbi:hypothetical protein HK405_011475, partial [Cladochytrium tenue]
MPHHRPLRVLFASHHDPARATPPSAFDAAELDFREGTFLRLGRKVPQAAGTAAAGDSSRLSTPVEGAGAAQQPLENSPDTPSAGAGDLPPLPGRPVEFLWFRSKVVSRRHADIWLKCGQ